MKLSVHDIVLAAKQHEIDGLRQLAARAQMVSILGQWVHGLQRERGASTIYLASAGSRFGQIRHELIVQNQPLEEELAVRFADQLTTSRGSSDARLYSLMAWIVLGLEALPSLRADIEMQRRTPEEAVLAFSRLIGGLLSLIFEIADAAGNPEISRSLVAFFHFIQGKEQAGQERALGALCFASGRCDSPNQQRILHLIEAQERSFQVFAEFTDEAMRRHWDELQMAPGIARIERLRRTLLTARPDAPVDTNLNDPWFEACSDRLADMWTLQCALVYQLEARCTALITVAERERADSEGLIAALRDNPPASDSIVNRFFDPQTPVDSALQFLADPSPGTSGGQSMLSVLQAQSSRLARVEDELDKARRALNERKVIERAKGILMARLGLSEEAAYKMLRKTAMDQNRRITDIAEATLSLPTFVAPPDLAHPH